MRLSAELLKELTRQTGETGTQITYSLSGAGKGEGFLASYGRGVIHIDAQNPLAAAYGICQAHAAVKSGYVGEFAGESAPRFPLRPVWAVAGGETAVSAGVAVCLPRFAYAAGQDADRWQSDGDLFCRRLIECGYNAVVLGAHACAPVLQQKGDIQDVERFLALLHAYRLKAIVRPSVQVAASAKHLRCCPVNAAYRKWMSAAMAALHQRLPGIDYIFWEGGFMHADFAHDAAAKDMTLPELVAAEIALLEQTLPVETALIYYLPAHDPASAQQQAAWMGRLCDDVGEHTMIAFPAVAGAWCDDHLPPHPLWEQLRRSPDISSTHLLPVVNVGMVSQGEGLWPAPSLDLVETYYSRLYRHRFAGVVALTSQLPQQGSMLDCCLWVAGQALWRQRSSALLAEQWFRAFRSEWNYLEVEAIMAGARSLVVELSQLRAMANEAARDAVLSEECRTASESVIARLKELQLRAEKLERKRLKRGLFPSIHDYMQVFARDVQRIVLHFLQRFNLSYPHVMGPEELLESFWMQLSPGGTQDMRAAAKVAFLQEPLSGPAGSRMEAIYRENRLL